MSAQEIVKRYKQMFQVPTGQRVHCAQFWPDGKARRRRSRGGGYSPFCTVANHLRAHNVLGYYVTPERMTTTHTYSEHMHTCTDDYRHRATSSRTYCSTLCGAASSHGGHTARNGRTWRPEHTGRCVRVRKKEIYHYMISIPRTSSSLCIRVESSCINEKQHARTQRQQQPRTWATALFTSTPPPQPSGPNTRDPGAVPPRFNWTCARAVTCEHVAMPCHVAGNPPFGTCVVVPLNEHPCNTHVPRSEWPSCHIAESVVFTGNNSSSTQRATTQQPSNSSSSSERGTRGPRICAERIKGFPSNWKRTNRATIAYVRWWRSRILWGVNVYISLQMARYSVLHLL